jgi:hypothetical protein
MYKIQMKIDNNWVTLGGEFGGREVGERISQFELHYMVRSTPKNPQSNLICTRQFRAVQI